MIKKIDWYIIRKFLSTFLFTLLIILMIAGIIDFSEKIGKFIDGEMTNREIIFDYYVNFLLFIGGLLWPLFTLIAVMFFTARMAANSEIISILNAGVSFRRLLRPYMIAATVLTLVYLFASHFVIPTGNKRMLNFIYTYIDTDEERGRNRDVHMFVEPDKKIYIRNYRKNDSAGLSVRLEHYRDNQMIGMIKSERIDWVPKTQKWRFQNYQVRTFDEEKESFLNADGETLDTMLNLSPADFIDYSDQQNMMTTPELITYIDKLKSRGAGNVRKYELELNRRSAEPVTIFILTIIGVSIAARKVRGGIGMHLAIGIGISALFIFLSRFATVFASGESIPVLVGVWLPNVIFGGVAVYFFTRAQK
ncbi:MAG TPA: LptF/LptG family permease [Saprospiraceae bacterium]|nr:LptF/LptG family permease [Saprospiraceae bacterium]